MIFFVIIVLLLNNLISVHHRKVAKMKGATVTAVNRSNQEQLRIDHIKTLEVLAKTTKENEKLKEKLSKMMKMQKGDKEIEDEGCEEQDAKLKEKENENEYSLSSLLSELKKRENELKVLNRKLQDAEKDIADRSKSSISQQEHFAETGGDFMP